ncbi:MAG: hypothetical protein ACFFF9_04120 [Candidatus Thorarchaeota archaeon]
MSDEDKKEWFKAWNEIKAYIPQGMRMITEPTSAFGTIIIVTVVVVWLWGLFGLVIL